MTRTSWPKPARAAFEAKVRLLENWVGTGVLPDDAPRLSTINDVRLWTSTELGLRSWTSYSIAAPGGEHGDLRARLDSILPHYVELRAGATTKPRKPRRGKAISQRQVELERNKLVAQNADLIIQNARLSSEIVRIGQLLTELESENRLLVSQINSIVPMRRKNT